VPTDTCVLVPNASTAFETIVRNLSFQPGDVFVTFANVYDSFEYTITYLSETTPVEVVKIQYAQPVSDEYVCDAFERTVKDLKTAGKNPVLAVFDTVSSLPAVRMPFETLTELCRSHGVLSCIDGAHGVGQFPIHLQGLDPDFFVSNCHKWLHVPRPCAVLYAPKRTQHLLRATLPVGFGFASLPKAPDFVKNFASVGTLDNNAYLCIKAALAWRSKVTWDGKRGEEAVVGYIHHLAREGGKLVASLLRTEVLDNEEGSLRNCALVNVRLPLEIDQARAIGVRNAENTAAWIMRTMIVEHETAVNIFYYHGNFWVRLCAQVYLTLKDFEKAGKLLRRVCEKLEKGEPAER
jgi:hercynylcysteine S-oxide lyase